MSAQLDNDFNLDSWSFSVSGTPPSVANGAAVPSLSFSRDTKAGEIRPDLLFEKQGEFFHPVLNSIFSGRYSGVTTDTYTVDGTLTHNVDVLNVNRVLKPQSGTMQQVLEATFTDLGFPHAGMFVSHTGQVTLAGGFGNVWTMINEFLAVHGMAMILDPAPIIGPVRLLPLLDYPEVTAPILKPIQRGNPSRYIEVEYYNHQPVTNGEVYPPNVMEASVLQADAGELVEVEVQLTGWLSSINQPVCVEWVEADPHFYDGTNGVYSVSGNDGRPVTVAEWEAGGGWLTVELTDNPDTAKVMFRGLDREDLAPYRIAMTSGNFYSSLRITGTGVRYELDSLKFPTGADPTITSEEVGTVISSPMVSTRSQALQQAALAADASGGMDMTLSLQGDFPELMSNRLIKHEEAIWLGQSVSLGPDTQSVEMIPATSLGDLEDAWDGKNLGGFEDVWVGSTLGDLQIRPLRTSL